MISYNFVLNVIKHCLIVVFDVYALVRFAALLGVTPDEKAKRTVKPKPITLPIESKPPRERKYLAFMLDAR